MGAKRPEPKVLWHHVLRVIDREANVTALHTIDEWRIIRHLQNLHAVGERPSYEEFKSYLNELWPMLPGARRRVRDIWRTILRDPYHGFRRVKRGPMRLRLLDNICREYGLRSLDERVREVLDHAYDRFWTVALSEPDLEQFLIARRDLKKAMHTVSVTAVEVV